MAQPYTAITIRFSKPGTQPPVFLAGSFSSEPWVPQEMEYATTSEGEHEFSKDIKVHPGGRYQYKFRLGLGDWWALDEKSPTENDASGFLNNLLAVPAAEDQGTKSAHLHTHAESTPTSGQVNTQSEHANQLAASGPSDDKETEDTDYPGEMPRTPNVVPGHTENAGESHIEELDAMSAILTDIAVPHIAEDAVDPKERESSTKVFPTPVETSEVHTTKDSSIKITRSFTVTESKLSDGDGAESPSSESNPSRDSASSPGKKNALYTVSIKGKTPENTEFASKGLGAPVVLDSSPPTPPMSDEEAGRVGDRRMSLTPVSVRPLAASAAVAAEVADTAAGLDDEGPPMSESARVAAEVANIAAMLDQEDVPGNLSTEVVEDDDESEFIPTPEEERAPRFPYECITPADLEVRLDTQRHQFEEQSSEMEYEIEIALNDPSIMEFPTTAPEIFSTIRELQDRLPEDQVDMNKKAPSPAWVPMGSSGDHHALLPSHAHSQERSSSMSSIAETDEDADNVTLSKTEPTFLSLASGINGSHNSQSMSVDGSLEVERPSVNGVSSPAETEPENKSIPIEESLLTNITDPEQHDGSASPAEQPRTPDPPVTENNAGPDILVQPATPGTSLKKKDSDVCQAEDTAKSTSISVREPDASQLTSRRQPSPTPERPLTPASMRSGEVHKSKSFLTAFLRVLFVDWIGGFFRKFFGSDRQT